MAEYIKKEDALNRLGNMIEYVRTNKDKTFNPLNVLLQVGDMIINLPARDVREYQYHGWVLDPEKEGYAVCRNCRKHKVDLLDGGAHYYCENCGSYNWGRNNE